MKKLARITQEMIDQGIAAGTQSEATYCPGAIAIQAVLPEGWAFWGFDGREWQASDGTRAYGGVVPLRVGRWVHKFDLTAEGGSPPEPINFYVEWT